MPNLFRQASWPGLATERIGRCLHRHGDRPLDREADRRAARRTGVGRGCRGSRGDLLFHPVL